MYLNKYPIHNHAADVILKPLADWFEYYPVAECHLNEIWFWKKLGDKIDVRINSPNPDWNKLGIDSSILVALGEL